MDVNKLLNRYKAGERDFRRIKFRGKSFKGKDLTGIDFSEADLQGANFSHAILRGANFNRADIRGVNFTKAVLTDATFSHATAGLQRYSAVSLLMLSLLFSALSGSASGVIGIIASIAITSPNLAFIATLVVLVLLVFIAIRRGFTAGWVASSIAFAVALAMATVGAILSVVIYSGNSSLSTKFPISPLFTSFGGAAWLGALVGAFLIAVIGAITIAVATATAVSRAWFLSAAITVVVAIATPLISIWIFSVAIAFYLKSEIGYSMTTALWSTTKLTANGVIPAFVSFAIVLTSIYVARQALIGNQKFAAVRLLAIAFAAIGGTTFREAVLTNANFSHAIVENTNLNKAVLLKTNWFQVKGLNLSTWEESNLKHSQVRRLLITKDGQNLNFNHLDLRGLHLRGANLVKASFIGADLSDTNLQEANLFGAKLVRTQLDQTDLTDARLTAAFIEDWGITPETKLYGVECKYVYTHLPTEEDPDPCRKPDNKKEEFEDGGFGEFIAPIVRTLDLYHSQGVDPRSIAIAIKTVAENNPDSELEIVAMEKRGQDKLLLRAKTAEGSDHSKLSAEYFDKYNQLKALPSNARFLLVAQDERIHSLENMLVVALKQPKFYAQGDAVMSQDKPINVSAGRDISGVVNLGAISGNVINAINQLPDSSESDKLGLKELLTQLRVAIEVDTHLTPEDKADALEQAQVLAEVGQNPKKEGTEGLVRKAVKILNATITALPNTANLVEACGKLLPLITKLLGF